MSLDNLFPAASQTSFNDADAAVAQLMSLYDAAVAALARHFEHYRNGGAIEGRVHAYYPYLALQIEQEAQHLDPRQSFGFCHGAGYFGTTITRPDLFRNYLTEQIASLLEVHGGSVEVGISRQPIPVHFALQKELSEYSRDLGADRVYAMRHYFDMPDLANIDDVISDGAYHAQVSRVQPLALFPATRIDYALHRLKHYTGTDPEHFQSFVLFTNYQFYVDEFVRLAPAMLARAEGGATDGAADGAGYCAFVEPGNVVTRCAEDCSLQVSGQPVERMPQMPAYHLQRRDGRGITLINIGVGPSNAKNITDHMAVLRPHCWLMLGHCAGLRNTQRLGDYVLAHAYLRKDGIMDKILDVSVPIPAIAEVQTALYKAIAAVSGLNDYDLKRVLRTGTVATVADRNWELLDYQWLLEDFSQSRAIALDMESATIAANGFRYRVPYGTLLCVSDKPLHGEIKLPGMADDFYRERVNQHLQIGIRAMELLRAEANRLHSRKLRTFAEPAFR